MIYKKSILYQRILPLLILSCLTQSNAQESSYPSDLSVCKLVAGAYKKFNTPIDRNNRQIGKTFIEEQKDVVFCSGTLLSNNYILTAAHCYQGNLEQFIRRESVLVPKEIEKIVNGRTIRVRPNGCNGSDWVRYAECIKAKLRLQVKVKLENVRAECTSADSQNGLISILLDKKDGFPHPFYFHQKVHSKSDREFGSMMAYELRMRKNANDYDIALWKTTEAARLSAFLPIKKSYQKKIDLNPDVIMTTNPNLIMCRSYGFGINQVIKPPTSQFRKHTMSLFDSRENIVLTKGDVLRHGDSGGPLICMNSQGVDEIVGVNSRVLTQGGRSLYNEFSTTFYNSDWLSFVQQKGRSHTTPEHWHEMVLPFEYKKVSEMISQMKSCRKEKKKEASREGFRLLNASYNGLMKQYKKVKKIYRKKSEKNVFIRADLKRLRKELRDFLLNCQFSMRGF
ncbi:trypsin-like serine protease [Bacteriovoracaceae bacterium]|nr:trypsin-like serine protease [Bacteriovoracaceae bacterium]